MAEKFSGSKDIVIDASTAKVWDALINPEMIKQYMFGAEAISDWKKGSSVVYRGVWEGKTFEDKGTILDIEPEKLIRATYYSPLSGLEDKLENYTTISYELIPVDKFHTRVIVTQEDNPTQEAADKAAENWGMVLDAIKKLLEK